MLSRRGLITGLISLAAAPAIVRASSLMPVKQMLETPTLTTMRFVGYGGGFSSGEVAATIWYMNEDHIEPIAFNRFFARVEHLNGR